MFVPEIVVTHSEIGPDIHVCMEGSLPEGRLKCILDLLSPSALLGLGEGDVHCLLSLATRLGISAAEPLDHLRFLQKVWTVWSTLRKGSVVGGPCFSARCHCERGHRFLMNSDSR